jgi:hypothetical protein
MTIPYGRAANELMRAQAYWTQAMMHRSIARSAPTDLIRLVGYTRARKCVDSARFHLAQCGALLGLNGWPK